MSFQDAFTLIFAAAGSTAAIGFIGKLFANTIASVAIKKYELINAKKLEQIKSENQSQLEELKSQLAKLQKEHDIVFGSIYRKREEIISNLYKLMADFLSITSNSQRTGESTNSAFEKLSNYYDINRLYFPHDIACKINQVINLAHAISSASSEAEIKELLFKLTILVFDDMELIFREMLRTELHH